ncbi:restriction endonuclease subunit S [Curtobacterium sp. NPDC087082]|uniref:restriction endonuclease subunit S n=1 Tax=Curtobacterium sp. NPDC087082 TaxID=3363966 RepID=UPI00380E145B
MRELDTSEWGEFLIKDLFDVVKGSRLTKADMHDGSIRHVGASRFNNGITALIGNEDKLHPGNLLTVCYDGPVGTTFYQAQPFWATDAVNVLYPRFSLNEARAMFLIPVIQQAGSRFDYGEKWGMEIMKTTPIRLPIATDGTPDWAHMESTMLRVMGEREQVFEELAAIGDARVGVLDTTAWREFKVGELFEVVNGRKYPLSWRVPGKIPLVSTSAAGNGISDMVSFPDWSDYTTHADVLTIAYSGSVGSTFYHREPVFIGETVMGLLPKGVTRLGSEGVGLFMSAVIEAAMREFTYTMKVKVSDVRDRISIPLPVTSTGDPDWEYMDAMMREVMVDRERALGALASLEESR